ncbi:MAG: Transcription factor TFIIIB component B [Stictis urceolatum]|nr:Transcription factor TFIIIB component B [Stictis urceolata]
MSSYLSKSKKDFKPKAPVRRTAAPQPSSSQGSVRGSVERRTHTPQPVPGRVSSVETDLAPQAPAVRNVPTLLDLEDAKASCPSQKPQLGPSSAPPENPVPSSADSLSSQAAAPTTSTSVNQASVSILPHVGQEDLPAQDSQPNHPAPIQLQVPESRTSVATTGRTTPRGIVWPSTDTIGNHDVEAEHRPAKRLKTSTSRMTNSSRTTAPRDATAISKARVLGTTDSSPVEQPLPSYKRTNKASPQQSRRGQGIASRKKRTKKNLDGAEPENEYAQGLNGEEGREVLHTNRTKQRREPTPEDAETTEIAPDRVTMSDLTKDSRLGRKSKRELDLQERDRQEADRKRQGIRQDMQEFMDNPTGPALDPSPTPRAVASASPTPPPTNTLDEPAVRLAPQVRLVNGQIVQDDDSRMIDRHVNADEERESEIIEVENDLTHLINAGSFLKRERHSKWTAEQTELFFDGLRMFGTDFMTISKMFPGHFTRRQIKLKFSREERQDREYIKQILLHERKQPNLEDFQRLSGEVYKDPSELERNMEEDRRRLEEEQQREKEALEDVQSQRDQEIAAESAANRGAANRGEADRGESAKENGGVLGSEEVSEDDDYVSGPARKPRNKAALWNASSKVRSKVRKKGKLRALAPAATGSRFV